jgi:DNA-binding beta-propeller fold protein YncE
VKRFTIGAILFVAACSTEGPTTPPSSDPPPPWGVPITGGTMIVKKSGTAVVADPDRDRVVFVDLAKGTATEVALNPQDEPGRLVEDAAGGVHVALRRGGAVVDFDASNNLVGRRAVCGEPRGIAFDGATNNLFVACNTGELVTLAASGGDPTRVLRLERDLRDVIVQGDKLLITRFRAAELLQVDATGAIVTRDKLPEVQRLDDNFQPIQTPGTVAWRAVPMPNGSVLVTHQRQINHAFH